MVQRVRFGVVPAGGLGSRLLPLTKAQPKEMLPLGRKPVLHHIVEELVAAGIRHLVLITGRRKRSVEDYFDEDGDLRHLDPQKVPTADQLGVTIVYLRQSRPLGSGHAVRITSPIIGPEPFFVAYGDCVIWELNKGSLLREMVEAYERFRPAAIIAVQRVPRKQVSKYGVVILNSWKGNIATVKGIVEKPTPEKAPSCYAVAARYLFTPRIYEALDVVRPAKGEWQLTDAIQQLICWGEPVLCVRLGNRQRWDVGDFVSYCLAFLQAALDDPEVGAPLRVALCQWLRKGNRNPPREH